MLFKDTDAQPDDTQACCIRFSTEQNFNKKSEINTQERLWMSLGIMERKAITQQIYLNRERNKTVDIKKCPECRKIITIYKNTKKFMLHIYPELKKRIRNKNSKIPYNF